MKESEGTRGQFCMSPSQVKQNLTNLEKDWETRRNALTALKHCIETMDSASLPRLLAQVSECKDKGNSRAYSISLYEDMARVHGKLIIPHIPRLMTALTKTLTSSGSSPQLQRACCKVLSSLVKYAIDESCPAQAEEVLRQLCEPLLEAFAGKLEPLAAGAGLCLQTLIESDKWKFASPDLVAEACMKTTVGLSDKGTRTIAHMHVARALVTANSSQVSSYGLSLLRSGVEALKAPPTSSSSWQQRASAARLLTAILPTVDRATLAEELSSTLQALDSCKHDRVSNVRWAVKEALKMARLILSEENSRRSSDGDQPLLWGNPSAPPSSPRRSLGGGSSTGDMSPSSTTKSPRVPRPSSSTSSSPMSIISLPPSDPSVKSLSSRPAVAGGRSQLRSPLRATRLQPQVRSSLDNSSVASFNELESPRKENLPSFNPDVKGYAYGFGELGPNSTVKSARQRLPTPGEQDIDQEASREVVQERAEDVYISNLEWFSPRDRGGDRLADKQELLIFSSDDTATDSEQMRRSRDSEDLTASRVVSRSHGMLGVSTMKHVFELKGPVLGSVGKCNVLQSVSNLDVEEDIDTLLSSGTRDDDWKEPFHGELRSPLKVESPAHLKALEDAFGTQKLIAAEDFLPFNTPRRLVRSLQTSFSCSPNEGITGNSKFIDQDVAKLREVDVGDNIPLDMDLGTPTSSSTGWSVRTNPIASDGTLKSDSEESDNEHGRTTWKKMAPNTPPAQETENPDDDDGFRLRLMHPAASASLVLHEDEVGRYCENIDVDLSSTSSSVRGSLQPQSLKGGVLFEEVEIIKRNLSCSSSPFSRGLGCPGEDGLRNLLRVSPAQQEDDHCVDKWSCTETHSPRSDHEVAAVADEEVGDEDRNTLGHSIINPEDSIEKKHAAKVSSSFKELIGRSWKAGQDAFFSWQFYVVVLAVPLAIALSKVFFPSDSCNMNGYLVPT